MSNAKAHSSFFVINICHFVNFVLYLCALCGKTIYLNNLPSIIVIEPLNFLRYPKLIIVKYFFLSNNYGYLNKQGKNI